MFYCPTVADHHWLAKAAWSWVALRDPTSDGRAARSDRVASPMKTSGVSPAESPDRDNIVRTENME